MAHQVVRRRRAISGGEISTMDGAEEGKGRRPMPMSLMFVFLTRALALFPGQHCFCRVMDVMVGSNCHQGHHCRSHLKGRCPPLRFASMRTTGESKPTDCRHH